MPGIVTLTLNPAADKNCSVEQVMAERKLRCDEPYFHPGGGGLNVARAVARLGGSARAYWACGGPIGELLGKTLDEEGIEHEPMPIAAMTRENLIVYERSSGQQYRFGMPGARITEPEIRQVIERLEAVTPPPDYLVLSGSLPPGVANDTYGRIAQTMAPSCRVVVDTSGEALAQSVRSKLFLVKPNLRELEQLAKRPVEDDAQIIAAARSLIDQGKVQAVVTSVGSGGAMLTTADEHLHVRAPTVKIRSKVGAGDSMVAGVVLALSRGESITNAVRFGVAAGSAAVMTQGTLLCRREDTERLFSELQDAD